MVSPIKFRSGIFSQHRAKADSRTGNLFYKAVQALSCSGMTLYCWWLWIFDWGIRFTAINKRVCWLSVHSFDKFYVKGT